MSLDTYSQKVKKFSSSIAAKVANCDSWLYELHLRIEALETANTSKDRTITELRNELNIEKKKVTELTVATETATQQPTYDWTIAGKSKKSANEVMYMGWAANEAREKASKDKNVVISGVPITPGADEDIKEGDTIKVKKIMDQLKIQNDDHTVVRCVRLGKGITGDRPRPPLLLVEFSNSTVQSDMLKRAVDLKGKDDFKDIYIKHDLTRNELAMEQLLRKQCTEMNEKLPEGEGRLKYATNPQCNKQYYYGIRFGRIEAIDKDTKRILKVT